MMPLKPWDQQWHTVTHISLAKGSHMAEHKVPGQLKLPPPLAGGQQRGKGHVLGVGWVGCRTGASEAPTGVDQSSLEHCVYHCGVTQLLWYCHLM